MPTGRPRGSDGAPLPRARKRFGQHFLTDARVLERIVELVAPEAAECVVEIGPGRGALTDRLAARARRLVAVEVDRDLVRHLRARYDGLDRVEVVEGDVLELDLAALAGGPFVLVGNVPYYITTPILFHGLRAPRPQRAVYLVQREVAERLAAAPGSADYGALTVNVAAVAEARVAFRVPAGAFRPPPKVESAVVTVTPRAEPLVAPDDEGPLRELVVGAFGLRRKQMRRVVRTLRDCDAARADAALARAAIDPEARPEELAPERFVALLHALREPPAE